MRLKMAHQTQDEDERKAAADYVAEMSGELAILARRHGLAALGYILEMAKLEAENVSRPPKRHA